jgi:hypothetical protein
MSGAILLVTWFLAQGQAQNYQVQFKNLALCETAKGQVFADADRLAEKIGRDFSNTPLAPGVIYRPPPIPPRVSAVCVQG